MPETKAQHQNKLICHINFVNLLPSQPKNYHKNSLKLVGLLCLCPSLPPLLFQLPTNYKERRGL